MRLDQLVVGPLLVAAVLATSCSSQSVNNAPPSSGGTGGVGATAATGGTAGAATGGSGGVAGSTGGDAGVDAASNPCAFQSEAGAIGKWPDSKTTWCASGPCLGTGQDGDYEINLPTYEISGAVVKDTITGLEWRKDVISGKDWAGAGTACATLDGNDAGGLQWRLPTRLELASLLDFGAAGSLLQPGELDSPTGTANFWTSSEVVGGPALAWGVSFLVGSVGSNDKTALLSVRCVRGTPLASKLEPNSSCNVVSDVGLGLMWYRLAENAQYQWSAALGHCQQLSHAGFDDWRLPSAKELVTIVKDSAAEPAIDTAAFGTTPAALFWSSTPNRSDPTKAQAVDFTKGAEAAYPMTSAYRARCVRSLTPVGI